jgi:ABC-type transporter Mla subunit MlaD
MQSLNALTEEAGAVVAQQEEMGEQQQQLAAALQEVKERKDKKQEEVRANVSAAKQDVQEGNGVVVRGRAWSTFLIRCNLQRCT